MSVSSLVRFSQTKRSQQMDVLPEPRSARGLFLFRFCCHMRACKGLSVAINNRKESRPYCMQKNACMLPHILQVFLLFHPPSIWFLCLSCVHYLQFMFR